MTFSSSRAMYYNLVYVPHFFLLCNNIHLCTVYPMVSISSITSKAGSIQFMLARVNEEAFSKYNFKSCVPIIFELLKLGCLYRQRYL
uniref:Uncharacterized protein n=1 Tax=uncultured marine virus TaxID=186617 RepID=A0A0F7L9Q3_9VIRU|nr:hypothetical protein [uncultured marine virus]